jgi:hypothetical protein
MNKKFPVALAASLLLANGASVALAAKVSDDTTTTSTTVPVTQTTVKLTGQQRAAQKSHNEAIAAYRLELTKYLETRKSINTTFKTAMVEAQKAFKAAREAATTGKERNAASRAFNVAVAAATKAKNTALTTLGTPPTKPA